MRNYDLYILYVKEFGLTFLPKGLDNDEWEVATELMLRALQHEGQEVTHKLIRSRMSEAYRVTVQPDLVAA